MLQHRPTFGTTLRAAPSLKYIHKPSHHVENKDTLMQQACIIPHQKRVLPLLDVNRFRAVNPSGDFSRHAPRPKLQRRPAGISDKGIGTWDTI